MNLIDRDLVAFSWNHLRHSKKFWAAIALSSVSVLSGGIMLLIDVLDSATYSDWSFRPQFTEWVAFFALSGAVPLLALVLAGGLLADETQDRTFTYLLVRPFGRQVLYLSKFVPIGLFVAALSGLQVLAFALLRLLALALTDPGARVALADSAGTVSAAGLIWSLLPLAMLAAALIGCAYAAIFAFVSLVIQRFHFLVNLLFFIVWELPWSSVGTGLAPVTVLWYGTSLVLRADPTLAGWGVNWVPWWVAIPALLGAIALWLWIGTWRIRRQDFHVTSSAT